MELHNRYKRLGTLLSMTAVLFASTRLLKHFNHKDNEQPADVQVVKKEAPKKQINQIEETMLTLASGGSVEKLLTSFGTEKECAQKIATAFSEHLPHKNLRSGLTFNVKFKKSKNGPEILTFSAQPTFDKKIIVSKNAENYDARIEQIKLTQVVHVFEGNVNSSFYSAALKAGVPTKLVQETVDVLSYVVNFQHGIQSGASFKILCEGLKNANGEIVKITKLRCVTLKTGNQEYKLFAYNQNGRVTFFNERGESVVRSLLQTPLNAAKLCVTSGFGMRRHPILGYNTQHKGIDFGAPIGTPVLAAGDGVVVAAGWCGGYGNRVKIRHTSGYETVYAHLKGFSKNIRPGAFVTQRQVIGAVGMTGSTTGPHLHFEVLLSKKHINPMKVQGLPTIKLSGTNLKKFELIKISAQQEMKSIAQEKVTTLL